MGKLDNQIMFLLLLVVRQQSNTLSVRSLSHLCCPATPGHLRDGEQEDYML